MPKQKSRFTLIDKSLLGLAQNVFNARNEDIMLSVLIKNNQLFAVDENGNFAGKLVNEITGKCVANPYECSAGTFARVFGGHGAVIHQLDNPPNGFFISSWSEVFTNPELLPAGTKHLFLDCDFNAEYDFKAVLIESCGN